MSKTINSSVLIRRPAAEVYRLLTTGAELQQWFAEHAEVDLAAGLYGFWGRFTPELPAAAIQQLTGHEAGRSLSYTWQLFGNTVGVSFLLETVSEGTLVKLTTTGNRQWEEGCGAMTDFWLSALENLRLHAHGQTGLLRCDYRHVHGPVELQLDVSAAREEVWDALTAPAQLDRYFASGARTQLAPGGEFSYGWASGGPQRVVSIEPRESLTVSWRWGGEQETLVRWELSASGGRTRLTLLHSGFGEQKSEDYHSGWTSFLVSLKAMLELGNDWSKVETDGYVLDGATA